jgi:hypothetical protein
MKLISAASALSHVTNTNLSHQYHHLHTAPPQASSFNYTTSKSGLFSRLDTFLGKIIEPFNPNPIIIPNGGEGYNASPNTTPTNITPKAAAARAILRGERSLSVISGVSYTSSSAGGSDDDGISVMSANSRYTKVKRCCYDASFSLFLLSRM